MVFTLHRYIFRETFKVFILTVVALTLILSLGSVLRPVQEYGVGPRQVIYLMAYVLPITLTFVLPMAALFAATLVYGRLASDNELDACRASGISMSTLVYPGLTLAIIVAIANLILSFHIMPDFIHRAEKSLKDDAKQILFRNIQRRGYYKLPPDNRYMIYADHADPQTDRLSGVVVIETSGPAITRITAAETAYIHFNPNRKFNEVQITAHNAFQMDSKATLSLGLSSFMIEFGSLLGDDIKFKKIKEMKEIARDPIKFAPIEKLAREVYAQLTAELLAQDIAAKITRHPPDNPARSGTPNQTNRLYRLHSGQKLIEFTATQCTASEDKKVKLAGEIFAAESDMVIESDMVTKRPFRNLRSSKASLYIEGDELAPSLTMEFYSPQWELASGLEKGMAYLVKIRGLIMPETVQTITDNFKTENALKVAALTSDLSTLRNGPSPRLSSLQKRLGRRIQKTLREIDAETHSRLVFGVGCVSVIMIGIGLGIIKKGGHLLSAFAISCIPAAVLIVCIMSGKNIAENLGSQKVSGITLMWIGFALLSSLAVLLYYRLLKN